MSAFVDCSDSFWAVACEDDPEWGATYTALLAEVEPTGDDTAPPEISVRIDDDPICVEIKGGYIVCQTT